jgi:hypothetical protein
MTLDIQERLQIAKQDQQIKEAVFKKANELTKIAQKDYQDKLDSAYALSDKYIIKKELATKAAEELEQSLINKNIADNDQDESLKHIHQLIQDLNRDGAAFVIFPTLPDKIKAIIKWTEECREGSGGDGSIWRVCWQKASINEEGIKNGDIYLRPYLRKYC